MWQLHRRFKMGLVLAGLLLLLISACSSSGPSAGGSTNGAGDEGTVTFYTYWLTDEIEAMIKAFNVKNPGIKVEFFRQGGPAVLEKFKAEVRAGDVLADLISVDPALLKELAGDGYLTKYQSPEASAYPAKWKDPDGFFIGVKQYINGIVINTKELPDKATWPKDWADFANPRPEWTNKICLGDPRALSHSYSTLFGVQTLVKDQVWSIYRGLAQAKTRIYTGAPQAKEWISSGQCGILFQIPFQNYVGAARAGAPVAWVTPASGMIPLTSSMAMVKGAKHPKAAQKFLDFVLSKEGQDAFVGLYLTPTRSDASDKWWPSDLGLPALQSTKILAYDETQVEKLRADLIKQWSAAFGVQ